VRLLEDNTIALARTERGEFFAVYDPTEKDPESRDRAAFKDMESADWLKFAFALKAEEGGSAKQRRVWLRAASLIGEVCERLGREGADPAAKPDADEAPVAEHTAGFWTGPGYRGEYVCPHEVGHGNHVHGCDGCCQREDFPFRPENRSKKDRSKRGYPPKEKDGRKEPASG